MKFEIEISNDKIERIVKEFKSKYIDSDEILLASDEQIFRTMLEINQTNSLYIFFSPALMSLTLEKLFQNNLVKHKL